MIFRSDLTKLRHEVEMHNLHNYNELNSLKKDQQADLNLLYIRMTNLEEKLNELKANLIISKESK